MKLVEAVPLAGALRFELLSEGHRDKGARPVKRGGHDPPPDNAPRPQGARRRETAPMNDADLRGLDRMNALAKQLLEDESYFTLPNLRPRDAATLVLIDRCGSGPQGAAGQAP